MTPNSTLSTREAYRACARQVRAHYENFPVASWLLPRRLRPPVAAIYAFARAADDFADEGDRPPEVRLRLLDAFADRLAAIDRGEAVDDPIFVALKDVLQRHALPIEWLHDLLTAFRMDVTKRRYANFDEVRGYCRYSANPVGRALLHLFGAASAENLAAADAICSALQLTNFLQDLHQDVEENDRIYLPQDEMQHFGVTESMLRERTISPAVRSLLDFQRRRVQALMLDGAPLAWRLPGRLGLELRMTVFGGLRILDRLARAEDPYARPRLGRGDWVWMAWRTLTAPPPGPLPGKAATVNH